MYQAVDENAIWLDSSAPQLFDTLCNRLQLGHPVAGESYLAYPFHPSEQVEDVGIIARPPGIQPLIEIDCDPHADNLLDLFQSELRRQHVVVEQHGPALVAEELPERGRWPDGSLLVRNDAPRTTVRATTGQKTVGFVHSVQLIIRANMLDLLGQYRRIVPEPRSATDHLAMVDVRTIRREGEDLRHIHPVVTPEHRVRELHAVALCLMPRRYFHQREIREIVPVYVNQTYSHSP